MKNAELTVKPGLEEKWAKCVELNQDDYSWGVISAVEKLGQALDEGKSPEDAEKFAIKDSGMTGFMAGAMAEIITDLHPRGAEFNKWWNSQFTDKEVEGTINPAIVTIKEKPDEE